MLGFGNSGVVVLMKILTGWGRVIRVQTHLTRPETISELQTCIVNHPHSALVRGCGRSYGDEALNAEQLIITTRLDRFVSFDEKTLEFICESGVTLQDIQTTFLPRGYALIVSPGTATVTVGGAIANDVHGKNHDRVGSFGDHVKWFDLLLSTGDIVQCSRLQHATLFFATIGGLGLTGIIIRACLQLQKSPPTVRVQHTLFETPVELITQLKMARDRSTYSVAWLDLLTRKNWGRGILSTAEPDDTSTPSHHNHSFSIPGMASIFLNKISMRFYNQWHYQKTKRTPLSFVEGLFDYLYPLDRITNWNVLYGRKGFYQFQCVIPDIFAEKGLYDLFSFLQKQSEKPYLTVLKTLGSEGVGLLSFPAKGFTLALDFPNHTKTQSILKTLADITVHYHGRVYLAKDATLSAEQFALMYPKADEFRAILNDVDAKKMWRSLLSIRLGLS